MKSFIVTLIATLSVALCATSCCTLNESGKEDIYKGNVTMHVIGNTDRPYNSKMYSSEEYAFKHPINFTTENKDAQLEVKLYLNGQNATEYLEVGESNLFTLSDENGNAGYVYITYAEDPIYHFWGID